MLGLKQVHGVAADTTMKVGKVLHLQHNKGAGGWCDDVEWHDITPFFRRVDGFAFLLG